MAGKLTTRQRRFVDAYDGNATAAALAAGYSAKTAQRMGSENLSKPLVAEAIRARERKRASSAIATREERQAFWTATMRNVRAEMRDRLKASELLGKSEGDFIERQELTGANGLPLLSEPVKITINPVAPDE
ncbi:MAG: terminase small subunit [Pyramidobacter sp.]